MEEINCRLKAPYPNIKEGIGLSFLLIFLGSGVLQILAYTIGIFEGVYRLTLSQEFLDIFLQVILNNLANVILIYYILKRKRENIDYLTNQTINGGYLSIYISAILLFCGGNILVMLANQFIDPLLPIFEGEDALLRLVDNNFWIGVIDIAILAPLFEEIIFRGLLLRNILKKIKPWKAILITALLFAFVHFNLYQFTTAFLLGLLLGWAYYKTRSLYVVILGHGIHNFIVIMAHTYWHIPGYADSGGNIPGWLIITGIILMGVGIVAMKSSTTKANVEKVIDQGEVYNMIDLIENLKSRNINAFYCESKEAAQNKILELVSVGIDPGKVDEREEGINPDLDQDSPQDDKLIQEEAKPEIDRTVGIGNSRTLKTLEISKLLVEKGFQVYDKTQATSNRKIKKLKKKALIADWYISSTNAVSMDGHLVNIDHSGNRVAALTYGPDKVIVVIGKNKITPDLEKAVKRARLHAAPLNAKRAGYNPPCLEIKECVDCKSSERVCYNLSIIEGQNDPYRMNIIIINDELGF